jgi:hypothetical protein
MTITFSNIRAEAKAPPFDRDTAALALMGYVSGLLKSWPAPIAANCRDELLDRLNEVRRTQGIACIEFDKETV